VSGRSSSSAEQDRRRVAQEEPVDVLTRWQGFGAVWRVVSSDASGVTIALCRCDGGEEVDRFT